MKVLGFWEKLFTKCVTVKDYQLLSDTVEDLNKNVSLKEKVISDLKDVVESKEDRIKKLVDDVNGAINELKDNTSKYDSVVNELSNTKDKLEVTLKLLSDTQNELNVTKQQLENRPVVTEVCNCDEVDTEKVTETSNEKNELASDDTVEKQITEVNESEKPNADTVITTSDRIQNFINSLSKVELKELKDDIIKGHANDKRISITMKNWGKKYPGKLETEVYFMFKTALNRRKGKNVLSRWYSKYDDM